MNKKQGIIFLFILGVIFASGCTGTTDIEEPPLEASEQEQTTWVDTFNTGECDFSSTGQNEYFILETGYQSVLKGLDEDNDPVELIITILNATRTIDGVETRVMEEREIVNGELEEISWNFFAICRQTEDVYYFGEDVDIYEGGEVVSHDGAWKAGIDGARAGIMMPGTIEIGYRYYQEVAPGIAMDRAEILKDNGTLETPAGTFTSVLEIQESTPLEQDIESKLHAPGIGIIKDEELLLTGYGFIDLNNFTAFITRQYAKEIASGVATGSVTGVFTGEVEEKVVYIVRLVDKNEATNVTIDALTGGIVTKETSVITGEATPGEKITEEQAKEIALNALPGTVTEVGIEKKFGKLVYVVEITKNYIEKDVIIDIETGEVIRIES